MFRRMTFIPGTVNTSCYCGLRVVALVGAACDLTRIEVVQIDQLIQTKKGLR